MVGKVAKIILLFCIFFCMLIDAKAMEGIPDRQGVQWRDTLYVCVADSLYEADVLSFSIRIYRPNDDWNKDKVLGDFDFYFSYSSKAFDPAATPIIERCIGGMDNGSAVRNNLVYVYTQFYAGRFSICGRADNPDGVVYEIPARQWVELCRVKIPMKNGSQNPGIQWDVRATGSMTAGGNPMILTLRGDVLHNPKATVTAAGLHVSPELQCQGEDVYVWVREAVTSGTGLSYTWKDSTDGNTWNELGMFNATSTTRSGSSVLGGYDFEVLGEGDTLIIKNSPGAVDGMYFQCVLSDDAFPTERAEVDTIVYLRDSLYAYVASSTPSVQFGMRTGAMDTVMKCPGAAATLDLYLFGPTSAEMRQAKHKEFGDSIVLYYYCMDKDLNTVRDSFQFRRTDFLRTIIPASNGQNKLKTELFKASWTTEHSGMIWVESLGTKYCNNGAGYAVYDTIMIQEMEGDFDYNLDPLTVGVGECVALDTATAEKKPYEVVFGELGYSLIGGYLDGGNNSFNNYMTSYCAEDQAGLDTVYYEYQQGECKIRLAQEIEVTENSYLTMKVLLEGVYLGFNGEGIDTMRAEYVRQESLGFEFFPRNNTRKLQSPYNDKVCLTIDSLTEIDTQESICDWVYIELQKAIEENGEFIGGEVIDSVSAFILANGVVCDLGGQIVQFSNKGDDKFFVRLKHRNHLIIASKPIILPKEKPGDGVYIIDFTNPLNIVGEENVLKNVNGKYCLVAGDLNDDGLITVQDRNIVVMKIGELLYENDINQDTFITVQDRNFIINNIGAFSRLPQ